MPMTNAAAHISDGSSTKPAFRLQYLLCKSNEQRIRNLCEWIATNSDRRLDWQDLMDQTGFTHQELLILFKAYLKTSPMAFIRRTKQAKQLESGALPMRLLLSKTLA